MNNRVELINSVKDLYAMGLTTSISGNHSVRFGSKWMLITPSGVPRYKMRATDLVKVELRSGRPIGSVGPSIELEMHRGIYNRNRNIHCVMHTHSPFTIGVSISSEFIQVIEEAKIVVGTPVVIANDPSGSKELAESVANAFQSGTRAVVIKNHGVVAGGADVHHARAIIESLEEWAKILTIARLHGGARDYLRD